MGGALSRDGEIKINAFAGGGSVQVLVPFRQLGVGVPELSLATRPRDISTLSSAGGDILVDVGLLGVRRVACRATTNPGTFLSLGSSSGVGGDGVLTITLTENTTNASRTGVVTLTPTGGVGTAVDAVLRITQFPPVPSLSVVTAEALSPPLAHDASGTITATVTLGGTATGWAATKMGDDSDEFITSFLPATGDGSTNNTLSIVYTANTTSNRDRTARIRLVATGGVGTPEDTVLTITQLSLPQTLTLTPVSSVAADYSETVSAGASPSDVITWTAAITQNPGSFITLRTSSGSSATVGGDVLTYAVAANTGATREGVIRTTFASTIRGGTILIVDLGVTQLANTLAITDVSLQNVVAGSSVVFDPSADNLAAGTTGSVVATITLGSDVTGWTATKEGDTGDAFITTFTATGGTTTPLVIAYSVNTGVLRSATINITPTGSSGAGIAYPLTITQSGAAPTIAISTTSSPLLTDLAMIPADPGGATGIIEVTIDLGGGATTWRIGRAGGARSTFIKSFTPKSGDRTNNILTIVYNRNTGVQRLADFAISTNGTPSAAKGLRLIQLAAPPTVTGVTTTNTVASNTVDYFHFTEKLPVDATGTITATIALGSTATGWTAAKDGDVGNTFITSFTGSGSGSTSMVISYSANTGGTERSATINITPTGASSTTGAVFALALTQLGTPSSITGITATNTVGSGSPVSFDPSAQDLAADATGTLSVTIALGGAATGWRAAKEGDVSNAFITDFTASGGSSTLLEIAYSANTGVTERSVKINLTPTDAVGDAGPVFSFTITQLFGGDHTLSSSPTFTPALVSGNLTAAGGGISIAFTLSSGATGWEATENLDYVSLTPSSGDGSTPVVVTYDANGTFDAREVEITVKTTGTTGISVTEDISYTQEGAQGIEVVTDPNLNTGLPASGGTIDVDVTFLGSTAGWSAEIRTNPATFLSLNNASGVEGTDVLEISYAANTTASSRTGIVRLTPTGGTGVATPVNIRVRQAAAALHTLVETPTYTPVLVGGNLTAAGGGISIALALGGGATGWEAVEALAYVSLTPSSGNASTPVVVTYEANGTFDARDVVIMITTTGTTGVSITEALTFRQEGSQGITVVTDPAVVLNLSTDAGSIDVDVSLLGSATGWSAAITDDTADFLTLGGTSGVAGTDVLTITYEENTDLALRTATVTLTATGGTGTAQDTLLTISQLGTGPNVVVSAPTGEDLLALPAAGGMIAAEVTLTGGATGWTAAPEAANPDNFLSLGAKDAASDPKTQTIAYAVNAGVARRGTVTFMTSGGGAAVARPINFRQLGAAPTIDVSTGVSDITMIPSSPTGGGATATITATITLAGGAEGFTVAKSGDDTDAFIESFTPKNGDRTNKTLTITYKENTGVERSATLTLTTTGGTGGPATANLVLTQLGAAPTLSVSTSPSDLTMIPANPGSSTGTITATITLGGGAEGFTVAKSGDDSDAFIESFTPASGDRTNKTLTITYKENTGVGRSATLTLTTTGGTGTAATEDLLLTQLGAAPTITVGSVTDADDTLITPTGTNYAVSSSAQTLTVPITLTGTAVNLDYSPKTGTFLTSVTEQSSPLRYEIVFGANTGAERSVTLTFEGLDGSDASFTPAVTTEITITQLGAAGAGLSVTGVTTTNTVGSASAVNFDPATEKLAAASAGTITATITLGGGATGWEAAKDGDTGNAFITSFTDNSGTSTVLEIAYSANTTAVERSATINITPTGAGSATGPVFALVLTQLGAVVLRVPDLLSSFRLYPNPANSSFVVETEFSDARISIQHVHGGELLRVSVQRGRNEVDIRHLPAGVYVVTLTTSQGSTSTRLIKAE